MLKINITKKAAVVIIRDGDGKVLLSKRGESSRNQSGKWENPGGEVEEGETIEQAAKREIKEELGIDVKITGLLYTDTFSTEDNNWQVSVFEGKALSEPKIQNNESEEIKWFTIEELTDIPLASYTRDDFVRLGWITK